MAKTLLTAEAVSRGGRSGSIRSPDGLLDLALGNPLKLGMEKRGPGPELLFAGAYAPCFHGAVENAARKLRIPAGDFTVRVVVRLIEETEGGYHLAVALHAQIPGLGRAQTLEAMEEAHRSCPYSKALRGDVAISLVADPSTVPQPKLAVL